MSSYVTIDTKDGRTFDGVNVEGWQSFQEALNDETSSRLVKPAIVDKVYKNGKIIHFNR